MKKTSNTKKKPKNKKDKNNLNWIQANELTKMAYKHNKNKKIFSSLAITLSSIILASSFILGSVSGIKTTYDYTNYKKIPINLKIPKITLADFEDPAYMYDSDRSIFDDDLEKIINKKIPLLASMNWVIRFMLYVYHYNIADITAKLYKDKDFSIPFSPSDIAYDGNQDIFLKLYCDGNEIKFNIKDLKMDIQYKSMFFWILSQFKGINSLNNPTSDLEPSLSSKQWSGYYPENFYSSIPGDDQQNNKFLFDQINDETNNLWQNESQEVSDYDISGNSKRDSQLLVTPFISTKPMPFISTYSGLKNLQNWFKDPGNEYLCSADSGDTPLKNLESDPKLYITLFPSSFKAEDFIHSTDPSNYFNNLPNKLLPIFTSYNINMHTHTPELKQYHNYIYDWSSDDSIYRKSLIVSYNKELVVNTDNLPTFLNMILEKAYSYIKSSLKSSFKYTLFRTLTPDKINQAVSFIMTYVLNIRDYNSLAPYISFLDAHHDPSKIKPFSSIRDIKDIKDSRTVIFTLPVHISSYNIKEMNFNTNSLSDWNSWWGQFSFYEEDN